MATRRLKDFIPLHVVNLFKRRGATVDTSANTISTTKAIVRKTIDREKQKRMVKTGNLSVS